VRERLFEFILNLAINRKARIGGRGLAITKQLVKKIMRLPRSRIVVCFFSLILFASSLAYGQNPPSKFTEHTIATDLRGGYQVVAADLNRDGKPDLIALASGMNEIVWWFDIDGNGKKALVNAPLAGADVRPPDYSGKVSLVFYRPGSWKREVVSEELQGVLHGIFIADWDGDGREEILAAGFLGLDLFSFGKNRLWRRTNLSIGNTDPWPKSGSSEIAVGKLGRGWFLAAIEPWHGDQVVVYRRQKQSWQRQVIDDSLIDGHTLLAADLNLDGRDEIIAGYRGQGRSVHIYSAEDSKGSRWSRQTLDDGGIAAAGCAVADLNGDGRPDVACIGSATMNLKWYENLGYADGVKRF
jgi:hypothetical protein